jgi:hypothetical protein
MRAAALVGLARRAMLALWYQTTAVRVSFQWSTSNRVGECG